MVAPFPVSYYGTNWGAPSPKIKGIVLKGGGHSPSLAGGGSQIIKINPSLSILARCLLALVAASLLVLQLVVAGCGELVVEWEALRVGGVSIMFIMLVDSISTGFMATVRIISARVMVFRGSYMANEKFFRRFVFLVLLFVARIFLLILSPNLVRVLLG